jgi:retinol-binding protein 3
MKHALSVVILASCASGGGPKPAPEPKHPPVIKPPPVAKATQAPARPVIPDTVPGKVLSAWLDAHNSGDESGMQAFVTRYKSPESAAELLAFFKQTGPFELLAIEKSEPFEIRFLVKEAATPTQAVGWLRVKDTDAAEIESLQLLAVPPGLTPADMDLEVDAALRARVIDAAVAKLTEFYVYPDTAKKMAAALREHQKQGVYDAVTGGRSFANLLTEQLQAVSHDRHLRVNFVPMVLPEQEPEPTAADKAKMKAELEGMNCGFRTSDRLDGNIGYVKFDMFAEVEICGPKATAAFSPLGDVDALIIDLRDNGGGHPEMVAFVSSYLFNKRTHLNDIYDRKQNKTTQYWTKPDVPGTKLVDKPVYVLTSARTFSAAEDFTYGLKNLKRATIVGETTGGGAHPTMGRRLDDHFVIAVPFARSISPITKTNWEGTGVEPNVKVPAAEALETAKKLATERKLPKTRKR